MDGKRIIGAAALALAAAAGGGLLLAHYARPVVREAPGRPRGAGAVAPPSEAQSEIVLAPEPPSAGILAAPTAAAPPPLDAPAAIETEPVPEVGRVAETEPPIDLPDHEADDAARDASAEFEPPEPQQ